MRTIREALDSLNFDWKEGRIVHDAAGVNIELNITSVDLELTSIFLAEDREALYLPGVKILKKPSTLVVQDTKAFYLPGVRILKDLNAYLTGKKLPGGVLQ